ncbi:MAG: hypothetical protein U1G07_09085 [Verrucomicrobiota bacterium]
MHPGDPFLSRGSPGFPERSRLRAGPLTLYLEDGALRSITLGRVEVIRRIYAAVRDRNWGTIPGTLRLRQCRTDGDVFQVSFGVEHRTRDIHFDWEGDVTGAADGTIHFSFAGEAKNQFWSNRIGLCVLHPLPQCEGVRCRVQRTDGRREELAFPTTIAPEQPVPGFHDLAVIAHQVTPDCWAELRFEGDTFEMEDQRNWIDASFKIFCPPLQFPFPVEIRAGTRIIQKVTLCLQESARVSAEAFGRAYSSAAVSDPPACVTVAGGQRLPLPAVGLCVPGRPEPLSHREVDLLSQLRLSHLRVDVHLADGDWRERLDLAMSQALALDLPVALAIHLPAADAWESAALAAVLGREEADVESILVFRDGARTTSQENLDWARHSFGFVGCPIGGGTNADFYQLNQCRPPYEGCDFMAWSMNPQVHAFDLVSLTEALTAIPAQLHSARMFFPGKPLVIGPVTLKPRFNPVATQPEATAIGAELPPQVDSRQLSAFAAGWTLAAFKHLAQAGAAAATFFETIGWLGTLESARGCLLPGEFPSVPGQLFPLYYALAEIGSFRGGEVMATRAEDPLRVESLALVRGHESCLCLCNLTPDPQQVRVTGFGEATHERRLDWTAPRVWMFHPETIRHGSGVALTPGPHDQLDVNLGPFEFLRITANA